MYINSLIKYIDQIQIKTYYDKFSIFNQEDFKTKIKVDENLNKSFFEKYLIPIIGIYHCWIAYFKNKKIIYVNYTPLWNILIFALCPPKTFFGPITGGIFKGEIKNVEHFVRKYFLPILYTISLFFLKIRKSKLLFSTENLKEILNKNILEKSKFNFFLNDFKKSNDITEEKKIDILIYYRLYSSKKSDFLKQLAINLGSTYNISIVGDNIESENLNNLGKVERNNLRKILSKTKFSILSSENFSSLFARDCIENNVSIFYDKTNTVPNIIKDKNDQKITAIDFDNLKQSVSIINNTIKNYNRDTNYCKIEFNLDKEIADDIVNL